ncbi:thiamine pyrophosphate-dependent dehydrogenase E1 component subunit alpha [Henriciella sp.]|uniref:thiamine pyrophosphate-dependent dehydrogenase E1 component subunit alpha n=1 Tax=Henriciella sp. TaxID=1968823 RepID=UPI0032EC5413
MYQMMVASRHFEDLIKPAYFEGKQPVFNMAKGPLPGEMHLSDGQEPCAVGVCAHLRPSDAVTATHRPHHIAIAKGVDLKAMTSEIFGRANGLSGGRGGHMHLFDPRVNFCCSGIIAEGMGPAVGAAMAAKLRGTDDVAVSFIGEGAANQGAFHETLNLAAVWKAPVVFVIEDNAYGISVAKRQATAIERNADRAMAYGMPGAFVPDNDPEEIFEVAGTAIERARQGGGPSLIEIETIRLEGHFMGDAEGYRPEGEKTSLQEKDPITRYRARLENAGAAAGDLDALEEEARSRVSEAFNHARHSASPKPDDAFTTVFA